MCGWGTNTQTAPGDWMTGVRETQGNANCCGINGPITQGRANPGVRELLRVREGSTKWKTGGDDDLQGV